MAAVHWGCGVGFLSWYGAGGSLKGLSPWHQSTLAQKFDLLSGEQDGGVWEGGTGQARPGTEQEGV